MIGPPRERFSLDCPARPPAWFFVDRQCAVAMLGLFRQGYASSFRRRSVMRTCLVVIGLLVFAPARLGAEDAEALVKEGLKLVSQTQAILKSVKDKASAEAALAKLKKIKSDQRFAALARKFDKLPAEQQKKLQPRLDKALSALEREIKRIETLPRAAAVLRGVFPLKQAHEAKVSKARVHMLVLENMLDLYKLREDQYPKTLKELTRGEDPILKPKHLLDPWKKPYQYDPAGPKNKGKKPDVWTVTPDKKVIGNWQAKKK
jgi:hypothetical protein